MAVNSVNFGQRPYGYDPKQGRYTSEQAKKDFKPGVYDPDSRRAQHTAAKVTVGLIGGAALIGAGIIFRKPIAAAALKGLQWAAPYAKKALDTCKTLGKGAIDLAKPYIGKGVELAKNGVNFVKGHGENIIASVIKFAAKHLS